ncbi:hypothetical protein GEU84_018110 [Fertoebacter nigrum]|uniref:Uncharacterized protein n=1 Tax=Fertoeibacter niger TaxID=2656921 RepID=A0A8X8KQT4_9RHOB|nr:hypothetical protein [Fertoeibacter niger]NUB46311.1 hypothetical protein [Fertoeibacter niger]
MRAKDILLGEVGDTVGEFLPIEGPSKEDLAMFLPQVCNCLLASGVVIRDRREVEEVSPCTLVEPYELGPKVAFLRWFEFLSGSIEGMQAFCVARGGWTFFSGSLVSVFEKHQLKGIQFLETSRPSEGGWRDLPA